MAGNFEEIAEGLRRFTVQVITGGRDAGAGAGVIVCGGVLTNSHVARGRQAVVQLGDRRRFTAEVTSRDPRRDLALLRIAASSQFQASELPAATFGDSAGLRPGELVIAIGNPHGSVAAAVMGVVHAVGPLPGMGRQSWVQAAVRLAPGNSGGPLADAHGRVIGINTAVVNGMGVAVPSAAVAAFLRDGGRPALGLTLQSVDPGLLILEVEPGSAAAAASLWVGDILTAVNGKRLRGPDELAAAIDSGDTVVHLEFVRGGRGPVRHTAVQLNARVPEAA